MFHAYSAANTVGGRGAGKRSSREGCSCYSAKLSRYRGFYDHQNVLFHAAFHFKPHEFQRKALLAAAL